MSNPPLTDEQCHEVAKAEAEHPSQVAAARALGINRNTFVSRLQEARNRGITANWIPPAPTAPQPSIGAIENLLRRGATLAELQSATSGTAGEVLDEIDRLHAEGRAVVRHGEVFKIEKTLPVGNASHIKFNTDSDNRIRFGLSSDKHYGSKYCREDVVEQLYQWFAEEGVEHVIDGGNYLDGEARFNRHDLTVHGLDAQAQYLVDRLPEHDGITTYAVSGDDHEGWYAQREGVDIGRYVESTFQHAGRDDWVNLGYMEAFFDIVNAHSGISAKGLVMHPGGGSAYAHSYKPQKIVESFEGGEKPALLLIGHYHKMSLNLVRNVWAVQCGCAQDQTPFMRKRGIDSHIGGLILDLEQDPETGALIECVPRFRRWFNRGYYNQRWTPHTSPTLPERKANQS